jgi:NADPH:quinone reductase-like Zn-dependent oxidoreductase
LNQGDDIAGVVHVVGSNVTEFRPGDRVASFHEMLSPHGSYGEYAVGLAATTFHVPNHVSFEEAATIPLAGMTAAVGLYQRLGLPLPWLPAQERLPLVIYGAASAVGAFAVKLASLSNIHPLICVAGRGASFVETLIDRSKGDTVVDYRNGDDAVVHDLQTALGTDEKLLYGFDAVSDKGSYQNLAKVMDVHKGKITLVLARKKYEGIPDTVEISYTQVGRVHSRNYPGIRGEKQLLGELNDEDFGAVMYRFFGRGLAKGWFRGHPFEVIPGGLNGIETGLRNLKSGKASAVKYVFIIAEPDGLQKSQL